MAFECGGTWNSCINTSASKCRTTDSAFEGTMDINTPDPETGEFTGWFHPKDKSKRQRITGKCSNEQPQMTVHRTDGGGGKHDYTGNKSGDTVKGKHKQSKAAKKSRKPPVDDDVWTGTKTT